VTQLKDLGLALSPPVAAEQLLRFLQARLSPTNASAAS
jgi:hypothetical protein